MKKPTANKLNRLVAHLLIQTMVLAPLAIANPQGGQVVGGSATITTPSATETVINQSTDKAIINWQQFNIQAGEVTRFNQPSSSSIMLNRVVGRDPSRIFGQLSSNGQIVLVNSNGVVFGPNSRIDVAALIATTNDISNADFMAGRMNFNIPGVDGAQIINQGTINATEGGLVALVAPSVHNSGLITARLGKVVLAAGNTFTLDLYGDDLILFGADSKLTEQLKDVFGNPLSSAVANNGIIEANGGYVLLTADVAKNVVDNAINMEGIIKANSVEEKNGTIILTASEGNISVSGELDASGLESTGGEVRAIAGDTLTVTDTATITATGSDGGFIVLAVKEGLTIEGSYS
jgi:filamentous hemagglutinin family protein